MLDADLPDWFTEQCDKFRRAPFFQDASAVALYLSKSEAHIYATYAEFNSQARSVFAFAFGSIFVAGVLVGLVPGEPEANTRSLLMVGAGLSLMAFVPLGHLAMSNMRERYRTYVAAVIQAAYCHYAAGVASHPWFDWLEEYFIVAEVKDVRGLMDYWIDTPPNSYIPYKNAANLLAIILAISGALLIVGGVYIFLAN